MKKARSLYKEDDTFDLLRKTRKEKTGYQIRVNFLEDFNSVQDINNSKVSSEYLSELVNDLKDSLNFNDSNIFSENRKEDENGTVLKTRININLGPRSKNSPLFSSRSLQKGNKSTNLNLYSGGKSNKVNNFFSHRSETSYKSNKSSGLSLDKYSINKKFYYSNNPYDIMNNQYIKNKKEENFYYKGLNDNIFDDKRSFCSGKIEKKSSIRKSETRKHNLFTKNFNKNSSFVPQLTTKKSVKFDIPVSNRNQRNSLEKIKPDFINIDSSRKNQNKNNSTENIFNFGVKDDENENGKFKKTQLTSRNIVELNEIKYDLKKSLVLNKREKFKLSELNAKTFLYDHDDSFESLKDNESENEYEKETNLDKEKNYRQLQRKGLVYDSLDDNNDIEEDISRLFIHPDSIFLIILDLILFLSIIYNSIYIPFFLGYNDIYCYIDDSIHFTSIIDLFIDIIYFIDLILHFFIAFYNDDGILKTELHLIVLNYLQGWFIVDLISFIPFKTAFNFYDKKCKDINFLSSYKYSNQFYYLLICLKLFKIFKLYDNKFFEFMDDHLDKHVHYSNYLNFYLISSIFCITIHVVTCILIFLGKNDYLSWIVKFGFEEYNFSQLYFLGIYYIITTITTVGYGDLTCVTPNEKIFGIIVEIVGIIAYSWVVWYYCLFLGCFFYK